jgi:hemolysin activation/secretion protein
LKHLLKQKKIHLFLLMFYASYNIQAQPGEIDAGQIINQIENNNPQSIDSAPQLPEVNADQAPSSLDIKVNLKNIQFSGNQALSNEIIQKFFAQYLNTPLTVEQIKSIPSNLSLFYRQNNLIAEITLPDQDITEGDLVIEIMEAQMGDVTIESNDEVSIKKNYLKQYFRSNEGDQLNLKIIAERILIVNELPGLTAEAQLKAGTKVGTTDVVITTKESKRFITNLNYDNYGSRSTGQQRAIASASLNNPFGVGDQISITALKSEGVDYARANYGIPVGYTGLRANVFATYLEYDVILQEFDSTKPYGYSNSYGLNVTYPVSLEPSNKWTSGAGYENRSFKNKTLSGTSSDYETRVFNLNLNGQKTDNLLFSGAFNQFQFDIDRGQVDLGGSPNKATEAAGADTQGSFNKLTVSAARTQFVNENWTMYGKFLYQWADQNLDSSEKLYLGGPNGVRAFPLNEGSGSKGYIANLEVRRSLPYNLTGSAFYDIGHVQQYIDNQNSSGADIATDNRLTYKGYGVGLTWRGPYASDVSILVARRHGKNPNPATTGGDQDGSNKDNFVWLRAGVTF